MNRKKTIVLLFVNIILMVSSLSLVTYAWMSSKKSIGSMKLQILKINSLVVMYEGNDSNYNGIPDELETSGQFKQKSDEGDTYISYGVSAETAINYTEKYDFTFLGEQMATSELESDTLDVNYLNFISKSNDESDTKNLFTMSDMFPSKIYTYKFSMTNNGDVENHITFTFAHIPVTNTIAYEDYKAFVSHVSARLVLVEYDDEGNQTFTSGDWINLASGFDDDAEDFNTTEISIIIQKRVWYGYITAAKDLILNSSSSGSDNKLDVWVQYRLDPDATNDDIKEESYELPYFSINFSVYDKSQVG